MKYDHKTLKAAVHYLVPNFKKAEDNGVSINLPDSLKTVAGLFFVKSLDSDWEPSYEERLAYFICQEAMLDLSEEGMFKFGVMNYQFN